MDGRIGCRCFCYFVLGMVKFVASVLNSVVVLNCISFLVVCYISCV